MLDGLLSRPVLPYEILIEKKGELRSLLPLPAHMDMSLNELSVGAT
jgi:hypothetical protein